MFTETVRMLLAQPLHLLVAAGLLAALVASFVLVFLLPGLFHWRRLRRLQQALAAFPLRTAPGEFRKLFAGDARLAHLWKEYQDSLHVQRELQRGEMVSVAVRSTLPAETFFNSAHVVDARLRTEFFRHLPGMFTGIGIIGTFTGLIEGLRRFQVSENAATVRASLESLMHSVGQAFLISASAIGAAMLVTFFEKLLLASLYARTEEIAHAIDARFDAGAGEDYLSRLVKASEDSALIAVRLKDALVGELGSVLREQTERQIQAAQLDAKVLASTIAASIQQSLQAPLQQIAEAVRGTAAAPADRAAASTDALQAVLAGFGDRLDRVLGAQLPGLQQLNQQTGQSMQDAVKALGALTQKMTADGQRWGDAMNERLQSSLQAVEARVGEVLAAIGESQNQTLASHRAREREIATQASATTDAMAQLLARAVQEMGAASTQMARSVDALTGVTSSALDRMQAGAQALGQASQGFAAAGDRVGGVMTQVAEVATTLAAVSGAMQGSATELHGGLDDYRAHRDAVGHLVTELRSTIALARKEAALTADVLARIQASSEKLGEAQQHADQYLGGISKVLGEAHQAFALGMKKTLGLANTEFHTKLATAVGLLSSTVVELEATLGQATPRRH